MNAFTNSTASSAAQSSAAQSSTAQSSTGLGVSARRRAVGRLALVLVVVSGLVLGAVAPAGAQNATLAEKARAASGTTTTTSPDATLPRAVINAPSLADLQGVAGGATLSAPVSASDLALASKFKTLSAGLVNFYAHQSGMSVEEYFAKNAAVFNGVVAANASRSNTSAGMLANVSDLDRTLSAQLGLAGTDYKSMLQSLAGALSTPDGQAALSAMDLARQLGGLPIPSLAAPDLSSLGAMGADGLLVGLFASRTLAGLAGGFPDVFGAVQSTGLGTPASMAAWNAAMAAAGAGLNQDLAASMLSPCQAALIGAMASGSPGGVGSGVPGCGACVTAGIYMHSAMNRLVTPSGVSALQDPNSTIISTNSWNNLTDWQKKAIIDANPGLSDQLADSLDANNAAASASASCGNSSAGTTNYLTQNMGSLFARLGG